jgi:hypothetical protein
MRVNGRTPRRIVLTVQPGRQLFTTLLALHIFIVAKAGPKVPARGGFLARFSVR